MRGKWTRLASSGQQLQRSSHCAAVVRDTLYVFSGEVEPRVPVPNEVHALDLADDQTSLTTFRTAVTAAAAAAAADTVPSARVGSACAAYKDDLFVWGGRGGQDMSVPLAESNCLWRLDTLSNKWQKVETTNGPEDRSYHTLTSDERRGCLYLHAGCPAKGRTGSLHKLDLEKRSWSELPAAPGPGRGGTVLITLHDGRLVRYGGFAGKELDGLDVFDGSQWSSPVVEGEQPEARSVYSFVALDPPIGEVVAVLAHGEREGAPAHLGHAGAGNFHSDVWALLDRGNGKFAWKPVQVDGDGPEARGWAATAAWKNRLIMQGGLNTKNERLADTWMLELKS